MTWYGLPQQPQRFPLIQITNTSIPNAQVGVAYSTHLTVINSQGVLTFTVTGSTGNWLSCNSSGFLNGTPLVADTENIQVTVTDATGAVSPPSNFTLTVAGVAADAYPLLYMISNGGTQAEDQGTATPGVTWIQMAGRRHCSQVGWWPNWSGPAGGTPVSVCQGVKNATVMGVPSRVLNYYIIQTQFAGEAATGVWSTPFNQFTSAHWWLYNAANGTGSIVQQGNGNVVNVTSSAPTFQNQTMTQWFSNWFAGWNINGVGQAANPSMDGFYMDNYAEAAIATGFWNTTSSQAPGEPSPNQNVRTGQAGIVSAMRSAVTSQTIFICGNVASSAQLNRTITGLTGTLDYALLESQSGLSSSLETVSWGVQAVPATQKARTMTTGRANSGVIWHADGFNATFTQDTTSTTRGDPNWQAARFTICAAMVLGCYYCPTQSGNYNSNAQFNLDVMNKGKGLASTLGYEYLGAPLQTTQGAVQTAAWQTIGGAQIWRRDFQNGIVLCRPCLNNPTTTPNTTSVTVTAGMLNNQTYFLFTSSQDATFNGGQVTSWTFPRDRDGIILLNAPA